MKSRYGLEIRAAAAADAQGLSELLTASGYGISPSATADRLEALRQAGGAVLVAADWGPLAGVVALHWYRTLDADQPTAQITTLVVAADERRRGIGRLLIKTAAQTARTAGCAVLELRGAADDLGLRAFCAASGFSQAGVNFVRPLRKKNSTT